MILAGLPKQILCEGTSKLIYELGATITSLPIVTIPIMAAFAPIHTLSPMQGAPHLTPLRLLPIVQPRNNVTLRPILVKGLITTPPQDELV